jgi:AAHS family 4-hydroxybenzoate transporter-like MFS transporter
MNPHSGSPAIIALAALIFMVDGFDTQAIAFVAVYLTRDFDLPLATLGPLFAWGMFGSLAGAVLLGAAADRVGLRTSLTLSLVLFAAGTLATGAAQDFDQLAAIRFATGIGLGGALPGLYVLCARHAPTGARAFAVTVASCGVPFGAVIGSLLCAKFVPDLGWRVAFQIGGVLPIALLPFIWWLVPAGRAASPPIAAGPDRATLRSRIRALLAYLSLLFAGSGRIGTPFVWLLCLSAALTAYFLINWTPALADRAGVSPRLAIMSGALLNAGGIVGAICCSRLIDRFGPHRALGAGFVLASVLIPCFAWTTAHTTLFLIAMMLIGATAIGCTMCVGTFVTLHYPPEVRGMGVGIALAFARIGAITGPLVGGVLVGAGLADSAMFGIVAANTLLPAAAVLGLWWVGGRKLAV